MPKSSCALTLGDFEVAKILSQVNNSVVSDKAASAMAQNAVEAGRLSEKDLKDPASAEAVADAIRECSSDNPDVDLEFDAVGRLRVSGSPSMLYDTERATVSNAYIGVNLSGSKFDETKNVDAFREGGRAVVSESWDGAGEDTVAYCEFVPGVSDPSATARLVAKVLRAGGRVVMPSLAEIDSTAREHYKKDAARKSFHEGWRGLFDMLGVMGFSNAQADRSKGLAATVWEMTETRTFTPIAALSDKKLKAVGDAEVNAAEIVAKAKPMTVKAPVMKSGDALDAIIAQNVNCIVKTDGENNKYSELQEGDIIAIGGAKRKVYVRVTEVQANVDADYCRNVLEPEAGIFNSGLSAEAIAAIKNTTSDGKELVRSIIKIEPLLESKADRKTNSKANRAKRRRSKGGSASKDLKELLKRQTEILENLALLQGKGDGGAVSGAKNNEKGVEKDGKPGTTSKAAPAGSLKRAEELLKRRKELALEHKKEEASLGRATYNEEIASIDRELAKLGMENEEWIYATEHQQLAPSDTATASEEGDALDKSLGSFKEAETFCEDISTYYYRLSEEVIKVKKKEYSDKIDELRSALSSTTEDKAARRADIKSEISKYSEWLSILENEDWLGLHKVPDVMNATLERFVSDLMFGQIYVKEYKQLKRDSPSMGQEELLRQAAKNVYRDYDDLADKHIYKLINYAINNDDAFFEKIMPSYLLTNKESADNGYFDDWDSLDDKTKKDLEEEDAEILADREAKCRIFDILLTRMLAHLSSRAGTKISYKGYHSEAHFTDGIFNIKFVSDAKNSKDGGLDLGEETDADKNADEDDIEEKESGLEAQLFHSHDRSTHETISSQVKRFLASVPLFKLVRPSSVNKLTGKKEEAEYEELRDKYNIIHLVPPMVLYNKLLSTFSEPGAIKDSDDIVRYFKEHMEDEPMFYGVVKTLERFPTMKSGLFNAFNKRATKYRVTTDSALIYGSAEKARDMDVPTMIGQAKNYDENYSYVASMIQQTVSTGIVLTPGKSVYDINGKVDEGGAQTLYHELFETREKTWETRHVAETTKQEYTQTHRKTLYSGALVNASFPTSRVPQLLAENHPTVKSLHTLLRGVGVDCEYNEMKAAFAAHPEFMSTAFSMAKMLVVSIAEPDRHRSKHSQTKYGFGNGDNFFLENSNTYDFLAKALVGLSKNTVESMANVLGSRKFSYANRNFLDNLIDNIGTMGEKELAQYFEKEYLHREEGSSYMYSEVGDEVLCGWISDLLSSKALRETLLAGYDHNGGVDYGGDDKVEYMNMSTAERVMVELNNYFFPTEGKQRIMERVDVDGVKHKVAKYSTPIHADSPNHVFLPGVRYTDYDEDRDGNIIDLSSHSPKGLLWRLALVALADYRRICAMRNVEDKSEYGKFGKKSDKFTAFPIMNSVMVTMSDGKTVPLVGFLDFAMEAEGNGMEIAPASISLGGATVAISERVAESEDMARDVLMRAIEEFVLKETYREAMERWDAKRVFSTEEEGGADPYGATDFQYLPDDNVNNDKTLERYRGQMRDKISAYLEIAKVVCPGMDMALNEDGTDVVFVPRDGAHRDKDKDASKTYADNKWHAWWLSLKPEQRLFLFSMHDRHFMEEAMLLSPAEREAEKKRVINEIWEPALDALQSPDVNGGATDKAKTLAATDLGQRLAKMFEKSDSLDNKLALMMREYVWNTTYARTQMTMLLHGDCAQFKDINDKAKRDKGNVGACERVDKAAVDKYNGNRPVIEYYGDGARLADVLPGWDISNQRAIYISDLESKIGKDGKTFGFPNLSQYWNNTLQPKLAHELEAADRCRAEQSALLSRSLISAEEYERRVAGLITAQDYADFCQSFGHMCTSDGQSFRTLESMRKFCQMLDQWPNSCERLYRSVMEGKKLSIGEVHGAIQQMKTFCYGHEDIKLPDGHGGTYTVRQSQFIKDSEACLFMYTEEFQGVMGEDSWLVGVLQSAREHYIDTIHFNSAVKLGGHHSIDITSARNAAEAKAIVDSHLSAEGEGRRCDYIHAIPWDSMGKQVPTPPHLADQKVAMGIQAMKILNSDIPPTTKYIGPDGKMHEKPTTIKIRDSEGNVRYTLTAEQYKDLYARIQVTDIRRAASEVERRFKDKASLSRLLIESIDATDKYPENLKWAVSINPETGDFNIPLDDPVIFNAVQSIIGSVVRKNIVKRKVRGGTAVQLTSVGLSNALRVVTRKDEETGMEYTLYAEAKLPAWTKALFRAYADSEGNIDFDKIPDRLKEMVGYRVPTEHLYSIVPIKIVGFLDEEGGTSVMLPQEIVAWSGSDFDIDKLFLSMNDFTEVTDDNLMKVAPGEVWEEYYRANPQVLEKINRAWDAEIATYLKNSDDKKYAEEFRSMYDDPKTHDEMLSLYREEYGKAIGRPGRARLFDVLDADAKRRLNDDFRKFAQERGLMGASQLVVSDLNIGRRVAEYSADASGKTLGEFLQGDLDGASRKELMNLLLELQRARLCSDFSFNDINRPGGFTTQKKMERVMSIMRNISSEDAAKLMAETGAATPLGAVNAMYQKDVDSLDEMSAEYVRQMQIMDQSADAVLFERNMTGRKMIGIFALNNSMHALLQDAPRSLSEDALRHLPFVINGKTLHSIGEIYDESGKSICLNFSGYLAASVDNAKDPVLEGLNVNPITANVISAMLHLGYSVKSVSLFMAQPMVHAVVKRCRERGVSLSAALRGIISADKASGYVSQTGLTHDVMASELLGTRGDDIAQLEKSPAQKDVLISLYSLSQVSDVISGIMSATKLDSPKNGIGNDYGITFNRMAAIKRLPDINHKRIKVDGKWTGFQVFGGENAMSTIVSDSFEIGQSDSHSINEYMSSSDMPVVQAYYDFGFKRPLMYMSDLFGMYSPKVLGLVEALNNMSTFPDAYSIDEDMVNTLLHDYQMFVSIGALARAEGDVDNHTISEIRHAWLSTFPNRYSEFLAKMQDNGRNVREEFSLLAHIARLPVDKRLRKDQFVLRFASASRVDKEAQNDIISSWRKMANDQDGDVRAMAFHLFVYSMMLDGCAFSPSSFGTYCPYEIKAQYDDYMKALRNLGDGFDEAMEERFLDQFIRNHYEQLPRHCKTLMSSYDKKEFKELFFDKKNGKYIETATLGTLPKFLESLNGAYGYVVMRDKDSGKIMYRVKTDPHGEIFICEKCEPLGDKLFREYDPESDLAESTPIGYNNLNPSNSSQMRLLVDNREERALERMRKETADKVVQDLAELQGTMSRKDDDDGLGNSSSAYVVDEHGNEAMRVHTFIHDEKQEERDNIIRAMKMKGSANKQNLENFTDEEREIIMRDRASLGSLVDEYVRLYFELAFNSGGWSDERKAEQRRRMDALMPSNKKIIEFSEEYERLMRIVQPMMNRRFNLRDKYGRYGSSTEVGRNLEGEELSAKVREMMDKSTKEEYDPELIMEAERMRDELSRMKENRMHLETEFSKLGFVYDDKTNNRFNLSFRDNLTLELERALERFRSDGDTVITSLGGSLMVWAECLTKDGVKRIGGELDMLVRHKDGSFSIYDMKTMTDSGYNEIKRKESYGRYLRYQRQLNAYRAILKTRYPDMEIRDMRILPIVIGSNIADSNGRSIIDNGKYRYVRKAKHGADGKPVRDDKGRIVVEEGQKIKVGRPILKFSSDGTVNDGNNGFGEIVVEPADVGIIMPSRTEKQAAKEAEARAAAEAITSAEAHGDVESFTALGKKYLSGVNENENQIWGPLSRLDNEGYDPNDISKASPYSETRGLAFSPVPGAVKKSPLYGKVKAKGFAIEEDTKFAYALNRLVYEGKAEGSAVKALYDAILRGMDVRDDNGDVIC